MLRMTQALSVAGGDENEDSIWFGDDDAILLDGASSLREGCHDAVEFVEPFVLSYVETIRNKDIPLHERVNVALDAIRDDFSMRSYKLGIPPSASLVATSLRHGTLSLLLVGDCTAVVYGRDGTIRCVHLDEVGRFDARTIGLAKSICETDGMSMREAMQTESVRMILRANRMMMNEEGGYRVLAPNMRPVSKADVISIPACEVEAVLLHSDGFDPVADRFLRPPFDVNNLYGELRAMEDADPDLDAIPRFKKHDDASALLMTLDADGTEAILPATS